MDKVFKAINDPSRRLLLDALFEQDAQPLGDLCAYLPGMTRYGVMNHLRVLEEAGLLTTRKQGRSKLHYLNPVPIKLIQDRWISKYAELRVGMIAGIKVRAERGGVMGAPDHVYKAYINGSQADVWEAITNPDLTEQYFYGTRVASDWKAGGSMNYYYTNGDVAADGAIVSIDAPNRIEFTFQARWDPELVTEGPVREIWSLAEINGMTELTVELFDAPVGSKTLDDFVNGFPYIVSGLKSLVETGKALPSPY